MKMYRGDLKPDLELTLTQQSAANPAQRVPIDLSAATSIRVIGMQAGTKIIDRAVTGNSEGQIVMQWQAADTDDVGRIAIEVEITWPGSKPQTVRPASAVEIRQDYA